MMQNIIDRGASKIGERRETCHKALKVGQSGTDLGLLQHDLRYPHAIRGDVLLPWQMLAAGMVEPCQDRIRKINV